MKLRWMVVVMVIGVVANHAVAGPGDGVLVGDFTLSPYISAEVSHDSNFQTPLQPSQDDVAIIGTIGLDVINGENDTAKITAGLWGRITRYQDLDTQDNEDFGQALSLDLWSRDSVLLSIDQGYWNDRTLIYGVGKVEDIQNVHVTVSAGKDITDKMEADVSYGFQMNDYGSDALYDATEHKVVAEIAHAVTEKTSAFVSGALGIQASDGISKDGTYTRLHLGAKTRSTDKLSAKLGVGYLTQSSDFDMETVSFEASALWQATEKIAVTVEGANNFEPAQEYTDNWVTYTEVAADADWKATDSLSATLSGFFMRHDYDQKVGPQSNLVTKKDDTLGASLRLAYSPLRSFYEVFAVYSYEDREASIDEDDYHHMVGTAGVTLRY